MPVIIDVREQFEYAGGHVEGALNIPLDTIVHNHPQLNNVAKDEQLVVYCRSGGRASAAMRVLDSLGYSNVTNGVNKETIEAQL